MFASVLRDQPPSQPWAGSTCVCSTCGVSQPWGTSQVSCWACFFARRAFMMPIIFTMKAILAMEASLNNDTAITTTARTVIATALTLPRIRRGSKILSFFLIAFFFLLLPSSTENTYIITFSVR